eukprot:scaffold71119_cov22-Tisochrysis_lutea.AAC.2
MQYQRFDSHPLVAAPCVQNTCQIRPSTQNSLRSGQIKCSAEGAQDQTINTKQPGADLTKRLGQIKWSATVAQDQVIHAERHTETKASHPHTVCYPYRQEHKSVIHAKQCTKNKRDWRQRPPGLVASRQLLTAGQCASLMVACDDD